MITGEQGAREIAEIVESAMREFNSAMKDRREFSNITRRRTTQIIWFSMVGICLLAIAMFYLIHILTRDTHHITTRIVEVSDYMQKITHSLAQLSQDMYQIRQSVDSMNTYMNTYMSVMPTMNEHMSVIPTINTSVDKISKNIVNMSHDINAMDTHIDSVSVNMERLTHQFNGLNGQLANINHQFDDINGYLGAMGYNVNRIASPLRFSPFSQ